MTVLHTSYVLAVPDVEAASRYWVESLGFKVQMTPPGWQFVARDLCRVMLGECRDAIRPADLGDHSYFAYIIVDDLDAFHSEIGPKGALVQTPPTDKPWGMREMVVATPDGHRIMFGQEMR